MGASMLTRIGVDSNIVVSIAVLQIGQPGVTC